jgi:hypothetical protein
MVFTMPVALLFTFLYNRTTGSVLGAVPLDTSMSFAVEFFEAQSASASGVIFVAVLALAWDGVVSDRMWQKRPASRQAGVV